MRSRKNNRKIKTCLNLSRQHIDLHNPINLIAKKLNMNRIFKRRNRHNFQHIPTYTETASLKIKLITHILDINQTAYNLIPVNLHSRAQRNHHLCIIVLATKAVNTRNWWHNNDILPLNQRCCRTVAQLIYLIINRRILLYISIRRGNICFRLIIIIIRHKIFYRIMWKKCLKLTVKLRCQSLIMCQNQRRLIQLCNDIRHRKCLTGTSNSKQSLKLISFFKSLYQLLNRLWLVSSRHEVRH